MIYSLLLQDRKGRYTLMAVIIRLWYSLINCHAVIIFKVWVRDVSVFCFSTPQHLFERSSEWNLKDFWLQTGVNSDPPSLHVCFFPSFFLFFCRLFWKLLIFVSVNPTFFATRCRVLLALFSLSPLHILSGTAVCFSSLWLLCSNLHCGEYGSDFLLFEPDFVLKAESSSWQLSL